jgi:amidase
MDATDLAFAGIAGQAELIAAGEVSSRELVELYLKRIERFDGQLNAFRIVFAERALLEADQADARRRAGSPPAQRPLLGVPIAVKDDIDVAGEVTALGSNAHGDVAAPVDAEVVRRLREAGAIVIGKTNVPELCIWPFTETPTFGATRNPWDLQCAPGGSSGGSGAAVAAGLIGAALGSDGAGSIRIPSAWCGLFGLKPQRGRVSMAPKAEAWFGMSVNGVLSRSVIDTALFHDVGSGSAPVDRDRPEPPSSSFLSAARTPPGKLRIAFSTKIPPLVIARLDGDARHALDETVELLRSLGHDVKEQDPDYGFDTMPAVLMRYLRGIHEEAQARPYPERLSRRTRSMSALGALVPPTLLERSRAAEHTLADKLNRILVDHDVLITPTTAQPPPRIGQYDGCGALWTLNGVTALVPYNAPWNLTGQPAASVPAGFGSDGLPRGVQIVGRPGAETTLLSLAGQLEAERPWAQHRPDAFA